MASKQSSNSHLRGTGGAAPQHGKQTDKRKTITRKPARAKYVPYSYEDTFDHSIETANENELRRMIDEQRCAIYATKSTKAGHQMDVDVFPEFTHLPSYAQREPTNRDAQRNLNDKNSRRECERRVNENFSEEDVWETLSYYDAQVPKSMEEAQRNIANYVRRVQYARKKAGLPPAKVVKVTDWTKNGRKVHVHHHVVISSGLPMEKMLALWTLGRKKEIRQLELDENGLSGLSNYITKPHASDTEDIKHKKKWSASKNLRVPRPRKNHQTFRRRRVEKIATQPGLLCAEMEQKFSEYWFERGDVKFNARVGLFYLSAKMREKVQAGDMVRITGRQEMLETLPPQTLAKIKKQPGGVFRVLCVDYEAGAGREVAFLQIARSGEPLKMPARACIVTDTKGRFT